MAVLLLLRKVREERAVRRARTGEREGAVAMRDAVLPVEPRAPALAKRGDDLAELGMDSRAVVALVVVLGDDLPVRADLVGDAPGGPEPLEGIAAHPVGNRAERGVEAAGPRARGPEIQEEEAAPLGDRARVQREVLRAQRRILVEKRGAEQLPVERVGPGVIRTADRANASIGRPARGRLRLPRGSPRRAETGPAMPADVVVGGEPALARARNQEALAEKLEDPELSGRRQFVRAARADPLAREDALPLLLEDLGREVVLAGKGFLEHAR